MDVFTITALGWIGGKMFSAAPAPAPAPVSIGGLNIPLRKKRISEDDDELLAIFSQHLARTRYEKDN